jgi:AraC family transcriptional regulator, regulatory protein of adaptative response / methylated-DNA-[protein]-cysteine methyltransferase
MWNENTSYLSGGNDYFQYVSAKCSLGFVLTAVSPNGICSILFGNTREELDKAIRSEFPDRDPTYGGYGLEGIGAQTVNAVETPRAHISVPLHLVGTAAQVRVWQVLQSVPAGDIITYE